MVTVEDLVQGPSMFVEAIPVLMGGGAEQMRWG